MSILYENQSEQENIEQGNAKQSAKPEAVEREKGGWEFCNGGNQYKPITIYVNKVPGKYPVVIITKEDGTFEVEHLPASHPPVQEAEQYELWRLFFDRWHEVYFDTPSTPREESIKEMQKEFSITKKQ